MLALENPHCGISGVPFINNTTGADDTALSMAVRVSVDRKALWRTANRGESRGLWRGRSAWPATLGDVSLNLVMVIGTHERQQELILKTSLLSAIDVQ